MEPEDGLIGVHGIGNDYAPAFTDFGIENLRQLVEIHKRDLAPYRSTEAAATKATPGP